MPDYVNVALVLFRNDTQKIVSVTSIENFDPKHETDFRKDKKYKVWLLEKKTEDDVLLNCHILLLGCKYYKLNICMRQAINCHQFCMYYKLKMCVTVLIVIF